MEVLSNFLIQIIIVFGLVGLFSFLLYVLRMYFARNSGRIGYIFQYVTGVIGTPVHELSHALACLIFGHRVTEMKLFTLDDDDCLGYVSHTYNPNNFYHRLGNFFIGIAPIFGGGLVIYLIILFGLPDIHADIIDSYKLIQNLTYDITDVNFYLGILKACWNVFVLLFNFDYANSWVWWVCIISIIFISLHMLISKADFEGSISGIIFVIIVMVILNLIAWLTGFQTALTAFMLKGACYILPIIFIAVLIHAVQALITFIIRLFVR